MKTKVALLFIVFFINIVLSAQTYIEGDVSGTWTLQNSPYIVTGDITVPNSLSLVIVAGVEVRFDGFYKFVANGCLSAIGTDNNKILFTSNQPNPNPGDWYNIQLNVSCTLQYCIIEYAGQPDPPTNEVAVHVNGNCNIYDNILRYNAVSGIGMWMWDGLANICHNIIYENYTDFYIGAGIYTQWSSANIENNTIANNNFGGILLQGSGDYLTVINNIIVNNDGNGIQCDQISGRPLLMMDYNDVWGNNQNYQNINAGEHSISDDPLFLGGNDYHLTELSPCIDAGYPNPFNLDPDETIADMGALFYNQGSGPTLINVPDDFSTIQEGIYAATENDTVLVQPGTYLENINFCGKAIVVGSLFLTTQDTTYISQTIIEGNQSDSGIIFELEEDSTSVLTGFTITDHGFGIVCRWNSNPNLRFLNINDNNGGILCSSSHPNINNITIYNNGSGLECNNGSSPSIKNVTIDSNNGRGFSCSSNASLILENVTITNNSVVGNSNGAGISLFESSLILTNCIIENNSSTGWGGGIFSNQSEITIVNSRIRNNSSIKGGAMYVAASTMNITECVIDSNSASNHAGAIYLSYSSADINGCSISNNESGGNVGGIYFYKSNHLNITNCTLYNNSGSDSGALRFYIEQFPTDNPNILNTICWNNSPNEILCSADGLMNELHVGYSDIDGGWDEIVTNNNAIVIWLEGNINSDPLFADTSIDNYHLLQNSPCIDSGIAYYEYNNEVIIDLSEDEYYGIAPDMGAYEWEGVEVEENYIPAPNEIRISNFPNPFNPTTTISYSIQNDSKVNLSIYNIKGQKVNTLTQNEYTKGSHSIIWNGDNESGKPVSSGIYYYKLNINGKTEAVKKCLLLK